MIDGDRGTGRTRRQLLAAPNRSMFVWCSEDIWYPRMLAHDIGRTDILIIAPSRLECPPTFQGIRFASVVLDHAAQLTPRQQYGLHVAQCLAREVR